MTCKPFIAALLTLMLSGCAWLAPKYERPALDLPPTVSSIESDKTTRERLVGWWREYHDPVLEKLIDRALAQSDDLALAAARLGQARAQYDYTWSNQFPLLTAAGTGSRTKMDFKQGDFTVGKSLDKLGAGMAGQPGAAPILKAGDLLPGKPTDLSFIGGMLSYEVDLWGKLASANESAKAAFLAASFGQDAVRLSVASATAQLYFNVLALDAQIKITQDTIVTREKTYKLYKIQYEQEMANGLVLRQAKAELDTARVQLPRLLDQKDKAESSLAVLLGFSPREIMGTAIPRGKELEALPVPPLMPSELLSMLLVQRPDIAAAEQGLIASNFDIGVARAAYFPAIKLSGLYGVTDLDIQNLYNGPVKTWQLGASMAGPLIDFGRTASGVKLAKARNQEQLAAYKATVRTAFKEVKDALSAQVYSRDEEQAQVNEESTVREVLHLAKLRFSAGYSSYIEVLDAERNLYASQIALVGAKLGRLNASVNLYKALGGGWNKGL
jgi:multidrug efflux system outer membrane protein